MAVSFETKSVKGGNAIQARTFLQAESAIIVNGQRIDLACTEVPHYSCLDSGRWPFSLMSEVHGLLSESQGKVGDGDTRGRIVLKFFPFSVCHG
jgi:hypothetical protein